MGLRARGTVLGDREFIPLLLVLCRPKAEENLIDGRVLIISYFLGFLIASTTKPSTIFSARRTLTRRSTRSSTRRSEGRRGLLLLMRLLVSPILHIFSLPSSRNVGEDETRSTDLLPLLPLAVEQFPSNRPTKSEVFLNELEVDERSPLLS